MASPNATFTEMVTTTLREHKREIADNVSRHNALLRRLKKKSQILVDGGYEIVVPLEYAENATYQRYSGYDLLNVGASDVLSAAKFDWKQQAVHVVASGAEIRMNSGKNAMIKLVKSRLKNAINTFKNNMSGDVWSDGTATNQINGMLALVPNTAGGTVGGIDSATFTFWKNIVQSAAALLQGGSLTPSKTTIQQMMLPLWLALTRGEDMPDLIVADTVYFTYYEESLTDLKRYMSDEEAQGGFVSLKYKSADVFHDTTASGITAEHMYFLNTDYLTMTVHEDANMTTLDKKFATNQDAEVIPIINMCNLTVSNRSLQGVAKA